MSRDGDLRRSLAVPYIMVMEPVEQEDGRWARRATYPELPGCVVEAATPIEAVEQLEELRVRSIRELLDHRLPVPAPRAPLRTVRSEPRARGARQE